MEESLPSRERGLKLIRPRAGNHGNRSLPSRERGLKLYGHAPEIMAIVVAPFTGAWIETQRKFGVSAAN